MKKSLLLISLFGSLVLLAWCTGDQQVELLQQQNDLLRQQIQQQQVQTTTPTTDDTYVPTTTTKTSNYTQEDTTDTSNCNIKWNISYNWWEKIYHIPWCASYNATVINTSYGERWFCSEAEARAAWWRKAYNCP